jgi:NAD(P)H-dependent FMN reductase
MKVVSLNGSPKGRNSNTHVMIEALLKGFQSPGTEISNVFLSEKKIGYCTGCYSCWSKTPGRCVIDDDMKDVIGLMSGADILIFGSPVFFCNISGTLKVFVDRLTAAAGDPHRTAKGEKPGAGPRIIMMSNCGFPHRPQFEVISLWIRNVAGMMRSELAGEFYTTNGKALTQPSDNQRESRSRYLAFLGDCGGRYRDKMELGEEQKALLHKNVLEF